MGTQSPESGMDGKLQASSVKYLAAKLRRGEAKQQRPQQRSLSRLLKPTPRSSWTCPSKREHLHELSLQFPELAQTSQKFLGHFQRTSLTVDLKSTPYRFPRSSPGIPRKKNPNFFQEWPRQTKPKKGRLMNFSQGHSGTKVRYVNRACFSKEKNTRIHKKMGEIHELFVLALSLVWLAGADSKLLQKLPKPPRG